MRPRQSEGLNFSEGYLGHLGTGLRVAKKRNIIERRNI